MANLITDWRQAVQTYLAAQFPAAEVRGGQEETVNRRDTDLICVWWPGWQAMQRDITLANPTLRIRYFPKRSKQPNSETPRDESALEQAAADLMTAMEPKRKAGDFVDDLACYISQVIPNPEPSVWCVDATVQAYALNPAARPA